MTNHLHFAAALLISLLAHGVFFLNIDDTSTAATTVTEQRQQTIRVVFNQPPEFTPETAMVTPESPPQKEPKKAVEKYEVEPKVTEKPTPKTAKTFSEPELPEPKQIKVKETVEQKMKKATQPPVAAAATATKNALLKSTSNFISEEEKQRYLLILLAHIESHKYYPRPARKRGIEGYVTVSFLLSSSGEISALNVVDGSASLRRAARKAVESARPLPKPPAEFSEPLPVKYRMAFMLQ